MPVDSILVVEDEAPIRDLIRARLFSAGYDVHTVRNGREALERMRAVPAHGVVLDINMPEMDGFSVLREMQKVPRMARTPVLILTARHTEQDVRRAVVLGAKDYLTKPFSEQQLLTRVARLLRRPYRLPPGPTIEI